MKKTTRIKSFMLAILMLISIVSSVNLTAFAATSTAMVTPEINVTMVNGNEITFYW